MREEGGPPAFPTLRENEEESGVVAQSLKVLPNAVPPRTHELGGLLCQQTSWDAVSSLAASENWATRWGWKGKGPGASESGSGDRIVCPGDVKPTELSATRSSA